MFDWIGDLSAWYYVIGFLILGLLAFRICIYIVTNAKKIDDWIGYGFGVAGLACYMIAGIWVEKTFVYNVLGFLQQFEIALLAGFAFAFYKLVYTPFAAAPDKHVPAATITISLAVAWLLIPSMVAQGYVPGKAGEKSSEAIGAFSGLVLPRTNWFDLNDGKVRAKR